MLVALPDRIPVHLVDFGHLVEPGTGQPIRALGRDRIRMTQGFPRGCLALALPGRIAAHIGGLPLALAADSGRPDALLILPAFSQDEELAVHSVVVQRVMLSPELEHPARPGDSARSRGVAFDSASWSRLAPVIVEGLDEKIPVEPVLSTVLEHQRLDIPRQMIVCKPRKTGTVGQITAVTRQIIAALSGGHIVRLNAEDCLDRQSFLKHVSLALELLPAELRGGVSVSIGLTRPDSAFQIGWAPDMTPVRLLDEHIVDVIAGLDPAMSLADAGALLFRAAQGSGPDIGRYSGDGLHDNLIVSTRDDCGIMPDVRGWIAAHSLCSPVALARAEHGRSFAERLASLRHQGMIDSSVAASLITDLMEERVLQPPLVGLDHDGVLASAFALVTGQTNVPLDLEAAGLALDLAAYACDERASKAKGERIAARTKSEVYAYLTAAPMLSPENLAVIVGHARLAEFIAGLIHSRDERIVWRLRNVMAMAELLGAEGKALAARAMQTLAPRDGRTYSEWSYRPADVSDLQQVLAILISDREQAKRNLGRDVRAIAGRLVELGRPDLLVDAMQSAAMAVDMAIPTNGAERSDAVQRRLEVVSILSSTLLRHVAAQGETRQAIGGLRLQVNG